MDSNEAERLCEKLSKLVDSGPGKDPEALREVVGIMTTLKRTAARYPRGKLTELEEEFTRWFTAREWRTDIDAEGKQLRHSLISDITAVRNSWGHPRD
jgi:hypothetical protein